MDISKERSTIQAINDLNKSYPYASSLLLFALLERIIKYYAACNGYIKSINEEITLGKLENKLSIKNRKYSLLRNDFIHSKDFLKSTNKMNSTKRKQIYFKKYSIAENLLIEAFDNYCVTHKLIRKKGRLILITLANKST